jgi:hypothetical protein
VQLSQPQVELLPLLINQENSQTYQSNSPLVQLEELPQAQPQP